MARKRPKARKSKWEQAMREARRGLTKSEKWIDRYGRRRVGLGVERPNSRP